MNQFRVKITEADGGRVVEMLFYTAWLCLYMGFRNRPLSAPKKTKVSVVAPTIEMGSKTGAPTLNPKADTLNLRRKLGPKLRGPLSHLQRTLRAPSIQRKL